MNEISNNDWNVYCQVYGPKQEVDIRMLNEILAKEDEDYIYWSNIMKLIGTK